jgi:hypothetical protein
MATQNLNQATARSQHKNNLAALDGLGSTAQSFDDVSTPMEQAAGAFVMRVQANITETGMSVTGKSSDLKVVIIDGTHSQVTAPASLFFIDKGVNPSGLNLYPGTTFGYTTKPPPLQPLLDWIKARRIQSVNNKQFGSQVAFEGMTEEEKEKQMAYAMRYSIFKKEGIKPKDVMSKEIGQYVQDLVELVQQQAVQTALGQLTFSSPATPNRGETRFNTPSSPTDR